MAATATAIFRRAASLLYTSIAVALLGSWTLIALGLVAFSAKNSDNVGLVALVAPPSLLVYLGSKLVVTIGGGEGSLAHWVATADNGSPHGALVLFLLGLLWLKRLVDILVLLAVMFIIGALVLFSVWLSTPSLVPDAIAWADSPVVPMVGAQGVASASVASLGSASPSVDTLVETFAKIKADTGFDLARWIEAFPPRAAAPLVLALWLVTASLALYIAAKTLVSLRRVLSASASEWSSRGVADAGALRAAAVQEIRPMAHTPADAVRAAWSSESGGQKTSLATKASH